MKYLPRCRERRGEEGERGRGRGGEEEGEGDTAVRNALL